MWRPTLRKSKVGEDLLEFLKQQSEKNTGSLQSGDILTVHLEVVSDSTLSTLGGILELCNITLFPDTCLDLFCISLSMRKSFRKGECHVYSWEKSGFCKLPEKIFSEKNISIPSPCVEKPWHCWKAGGWLCFKISKMRRPSQHLRGLMNGSLVPLAEEPTWKIHRGDVSDGVCSLMLVWITVWWERGKEQPIQTVLILFSQQSKALLGGEHAGNTIITQLLLLWDRQRLVLEEPT